MALAAYQQAAAMANHEHLVDRADDDYDAADGYDDSLDSTCKHCNGNGTDPWCDHLLPCPTCGGDGGCQ